MAKWGGGAHHEAWPLAERRWRAAGPANQKKCAFGVDQPDGQALVQSAARCGRERPWTIRHALTPVPAFALGEQSIRAASDNGEASISGRMSVSSPQQQDSEEQQETAEERLKRISEKHCQEKTSLSPPWAADMCLTMQGIDYRITFTSAPRERLGPSGRGLLSPGIGSSSRDSSARSGLLREYSARHL